MTKVMRGLSCVVLVGALAMTGAPAHAADATDDDFAVYEDWSSTDHIRGDRWGGVANSAQDMEKEQSGHRAHLRLRREGVRGFDAGFAGAALNLATARPTTVDRFDVDVKVADVELIGCAANPTPSSVLPVQVSLNKFNDGTQAVPGNFIGDHFGRLQLVRTSTSMDPAGELQVQLVIFRCVNASCSVVTTIPDGFVILPDRVSIGDRVRLRLVWDAANNQFVGSVNDQPPVALPYPPELNQGPARAPRANIGLFGVGANCADAAGVADMSVEVGEVRTNPSAVIP